MTTKPAFEKVVTDHGPTVLRVCAAVVGSGDADNAWSETFLSAMQAYPELPVDANVEAWLVRIAHRKAIDIIRVRQRSAVITDQVPEQVSAIGIPGSTDHTIWDDVSRLPTKQREVIAYHFLGGLPYGDIAEILGGSTDAARRAAADGMKTLRIAVAENYSKEVAR